MIIPFILVERVAIGSFEHLLPILLGVIIALLFIIQSKRKFTKTQQKKALHYFAIFVSLTVATFHLYRLAFQQYNFKTDLPLYLCSLLALLIPLFSYYRRFWMYEILLFWIIAGTLQGVITPDIAEGFPTFDYFRYWIVHLGLLTIIFYATFVFGMRPTFKSVFKSFFALQIYVTIMILINWVLDANYFYLNEKPKSASVLDYFGEWPFYIIVVQLLLIPYFLIIYLPFYLAKRRKYSKSISQIAD
ncbi:MAG: TIGR02206 family membrane protein [Aquaticitalea sp.]